jgi:RNA polymerase sigma-70 factor (subfamily 1)
MRLSREWSRGLMDSMTLDLLSRARAGDSEALGELCASYQNYMGMLIRTGLGARLRAHVEVSDVIQETLVEVIRQFHQFNGQTEAAVVGWMRNLVSQKLADLGRHYGRVKRNGHGRTLPLDVTPGDRRNGDESGQIIDMLVLSQTSPSQAASRREEISRLADALAGLADEQADVLWLFFAEDLSFTAIGERMNLSRKSVRTIVACGLKHLRHALAGPPGGALRFKNDRASQ